MEKIGLNELREAYLGFFERKGHLRVPSASLVPQNDDSLLLIPAGMAPLKPYFTGQQKPPSVRMVSCQKCVRTNDIESVGMTSRHATFFEMLGNFSFGDYFKVESIAWAWEFLTATLGVPEGLLYPSVYEEDDETFDIWRDKMGIDENRIVRLGKADNFWEHGVGPCGPCSEIYYDRGAEHTCDNADCKPGCECDRFVEIWNLVFTQFNKNEDGTYTPLEKKNIDTGMGLERIAFALQGVSSIFDVDTIKAVRDAVCAAAKVEYGASASTDKSVLIITDHARAVTFLLSDGVLPSNEGRGYVLRRLLRRAALHGKLLGINKSFFNDISKAVLAQCQGAYPELRERAGFIGKNIEIEERRFHETLDQGLDALKKRLQNRAGLNFGELAFVMYDTYGFPAELTLEILKNEDIAVDEAAFEAAFGDEMEKQRRRAREARGESNYMGAKETALTRLPGDMSTEFAGFGKDCQTSTILALIKDDAAVESVAAGDTFIAVPDRSVLYAEGGGQAGDSGVITTETGVAQIYDCKPSGAKSAHYGRVTSGVITTGQKADITLDTGKREETARNHSATHLLHRALKQILGDHVEQSGSLVTQSRLRFDFSHFEPLGAEQIRAVEADVNFHILGDHPVIIQETTPDKAREMGALALFGEKYGDIVRVVNISGASVELCGGAHVRNTACIGLFKILSETGIAAGVRRIEAVTGLNTIKYYHDMEDRQKSMAALLKTSPDGVSDKVAALLAERSDLQKELARLKTSATSGLGDELYAKREQVGPLVLIAAEVEMDDGAARRELADKLRDKLGNDAGLILLVFKTPDTGTFLAAATPNAVKSGVHCGNIVKDVLTALGGRGGGKPDMAQGGFPTDVDSIKILNSARAKI